MTQVIGIGIVNLVSSFSVERSELRRYEVLTQEPGSLWLSSLSLSS